jgi:hypothetical protein
LAGGFGLPPGDWRFVKLGIRNLDHEFADLVVEGVEGEGRMGPKSTLKTP